MRTVAALALVLTVALCFLAREAQAQCVVPKPLFCTNVDWSVPNATAILMTGPNSPELQIDTVYATFEGSRRCKNWYAELYCRWAYPKCIPASAGGFSVSYPCRSACQRFAEACPGGPQTCASFPTTDCYTWDGSSAVERAPVTRVFAATLAAIFGGLYALQRLL